MEELGELMNFLALVILATMLLSVPFYQPAKSHQYYQKQIKGAGK